MALTTCILEMRDIMVKLLPEVLLNMSKLSATTQIAVPVLEFLSSEYNKIKIYQFIFTHKICLCFYSVEPSSKSVL